MEKKIPVYDQMGQQVETPLILEGVEELDVHPVVTAVATRVCLNNRRAFSANTKSRGEVNYSNKKPWKQKGTGRARAGRKGAPHWRGGGKAHGPKAGGRQLKVNAEVYRQALHALLMKMLNSGRIACMDANLSSQAGRVLTKDVQALMTTAAQVTGCVGKKAMLFLANDDVEMRFGCQNLGNIVIEEFGRRDLIELAKADAWVFLKKDWAQFESMVSTWLG